MPPKVNPKSRTTDKAQVESSNSATGTLLRGLRILESLADAPSPLSLAELADRVKFDNSTAHRLVQLLVDEGYVVRLDASKRYCLGPRSISLLPAYHPLNNLIRDTYDAMQNVRDETGETVSLIVFLGVERVVVNLVQGRENLPTAYGMWLRTTFHGSASGKCLLMTMSPDEVRGLLGPGPLPAATEFTTTDVSELLIDLSSAREAGFVVARDDSFVGLTALGAPIVRNQRAVAALCIAGSSTRLTESVAEKYGTVLARAASLMSNVTPSVRSLADWVGI